MGIQEIPHGYYIVGPDGTRHRNFDDEIIAHVSPSQPEVNHVVPSAPIEKQIPEQNTPSPFKLLRFRPLRHR
ncbi:MAG TPA: hypothetical protein VF189_04830 [Patescibacteria group bacterium]